MKQTNMSFAGTVKRLLFVVLIAAIAVSAVPYKAAAEENKDLITSFSDLKAAINAANDGDTLYVGDIDFSPVGGVNNTWMRIEANKSLTFKSGKKDGKSVFTNGSIILTGSKSAGGKNTFYFENIIFEGGIDTAELKTTDFDYPWSETEQCFTMNEPEMAQYAISFKGNVDAEFVGCDFRNYMHEYGPVMHIRYGDYTQSPSLLEMFGDYSNCTLNIKFSRCNITGNAAFYDGGAIYISGNNNVTLTAADCVFGNNYSGEGDFRFGGGAIFASGAKIVMERCRIENNSANHLFPDMDLPDEDKHEGGGLCLHSSNLTLTNSYITGNSASMGGGIAFTDSDAVIDGCVFTGNRAEEHSTNWTGDLGPWNNMAQGGAIYHTGLTGTKVTVINSSIYKNSAQNAYGGIYSHYSGVVVEIADGQLELKLCTYAGNTCDSEYDYSAEDMFPWCSHPGDILEIPQLNMSGCVIIDDTFEKDFPRNEQPTADNAYNYIASPAAAVSDGLSVKYPETPSHFTPDIPEGKDFSVPAEYAAELLNGRYDGALKNVHVGNNYDASLYPSADLPASDTDVRKSAKFPYWIIALAAAVIAVIAIVIVVIRKKSNKNAGDSENILPENAAEPEQSGQPVVKAWFTKSEIETILTSFPKAQTMTGREVEVFTEMLEGKRQKEIAYDLGIEITTVKDFYRKIYDKLESANKDDLLKKCSEFVSKK